jgi:hypothetical protein
MPKITNLPESTTITSDDYVVIVDNPGGTPITKKILKSNFDIDSRATFDTRADAIANTIPSTTDVIRLMGYTSAGDGGEAVYKRIAGPASNAWNFQSADGAYWELLRDSGGFINADALGITGDDATDVTTNLQDLFSLGGRIRLGKDKLYVISAALEMPSDFELDMNNARIRTATTGYTRGTSPNQAAGLIPSVGNSTTDGTLFNENIEIYNGRFLIGTNIQIIGVMVQSVKNFRLHDCTFEAQNAADSPRLLIVNGASHNVRIYNNVFKFEATISGDDKGACAAVRASGSAVSTAYNYDIEFRNNYFYKNSTTSNAEIFWVNGGSQQVRDIRIIDNVFESGNSDIAPSDVTVYNYSNGETITTSLVKGCIFSRNSFIVGSGLAKDCLLVGFTGDVRPLEGLVITNNTFKTESRTDHVAIKTLSPSEATIISDNISFANGGTFISGLATLAQANGLKALGNSLYGSYAVAFGNVDYVNNNYCEECTRFVNRPLVASGNVVDLVTLNFAEVTSGTVPTVKFNNNKMTVSNYTSGTVRATYYVSSSSEFIIENETVLYDSADSWQVVRSKSSGNGADNIIFRNNNLSLGAGASGTKPTFQLFTTELKGSGGNWLFDQWEDSIANTFGFGVSGYLPQIGHIQTLDDVSNGGEYARMRISGAWRSLSEGITYETRAAAIAANIPSGLDSIKLMGYTTAGDGGEATYKRISTPAPVEAWHFQSADGAYWELVPTDKRINVFQLGATGDGVTNDTTAIQNAIDFANSDRHGVYVPAPANNYLISSLDLEDFSGSFFQGAGKKSVLFKITGTVNNAIILNSGVSGSSGSINNVNIGNFKVDCTSATSVTTAIYADNFKRGSIHDIEVVGAETSFRFGYGWLCTLERLVSTNHTTYGYHFDGGNINAITGINLNATTTSNTAINFKIVANSLTLIRPSSEGAPLKGFVLDAGCRQITIDGAHVEGANCGIYSDMNDSVSGILTIRNCSFFDADYPLSMSNNCPRVTFRDNSIEHNTIANITIQIDADSFEAVGNYIDGGTSQQEVDMYSFNTLSNMGWAEVAEVSRIVKFNKNNFEFYDNSLPVTANTETTIPHIKSVTLGAAGEMTIIQRLSGTNTSEEKIMYRIAEDAGVTYTSVATVGTTLVDGIGIAAGNTNLTITTVFSGSISLRMNHYAD